MTDAVFGIRIDADGKAFVTEVSGARSEMEKLGKTARDSNRTAKTESDNFVQSLRRQADTIGMTKSQTLAYEASQHKLTAAQALAAQQSIQAIAAHERQQRALLFLQNRVLLVAGVIGAAFVGSLKSSVSAALEAEQASFRLQAVLLATGHAAGLTKMQLDAMAESMQERTGIDDEQIRHSMAALATFRKVQGEAFGEALEVAANLSKVMRTDLHSAVTQLGRALEDPVAGLTMLTRSGVSFDPVQKELIKDLVETGRQAEAITLILQTMREQGLDKTAESMNRGLFRATNSARNAWGDLLETIGQTRVVKGPVESVLGSLTDYLKDMRNVIESGDWLDRLAFFTVGYSTADIVGKRNPAAGASALTDYEFDAANAANREQAQLQDARGRVSEFLEGFAGDSEKLEKEIRRWRALAAQAQLTPAETAAGEARIRGESLKAAEGKRKEFIKALQDEAATLGMNAEAAKLYQAQQLGIRGTSLDLVKTTLEKIAAFNGERAALKAWVDDAMSLRSNNFKKQKMQM